METHSILRKIFLLSFALISFLSLTTCDLTKKDDTQTDEHCTSTDNVTRYFKMDAAGFQYTYYVTKEGQDIILGYFSNQFTNICPDKPIHIVFNCRLLKNQEKPVQVTAKYLWHNDVNEQEITLYKTDPVPTEYNFWNATDIDLSSYYLTGSYANVKVAFFFKFFSTENVTADEDYFKSVFSSFEVELQYYPY